MEITETLIKQELQNICQKIKDTKNNVLTEEATKMAYIVPFLQILGYDVFNPNEVIPEFISDIGSKKGEKVDYVIIKNEKPIIIIECKHWKKDIKAHNSQLHRYFHTTNARYGIITNGIIYNFFTDLEKVNIMDNTPFFSIDLRNLNDESISVLLSFSKSKFDTSTIHRKAKILKYKNGIQSNLEKELSEPSHDFIKILAKGVFSNQSKGNQWKEFSEIAKKIIKEKFNKKTERQNISKKLYEDISDNHIKDEVYKASNEELKGFEIVCSILKEKISVNRIFWRNTTFFFRIILDDNRKKLICRLYFKNNEKHIELFHNGKEHPLKKALKNIEDIRLYKSELLQTIDNQFFK